MGLFFIIMGAICLVANAAMLAVNLTDREPVALPLLGALCSSVAISNGVSVL